VTDSSGALFGAQKKAALLEALPARRLAVPSGRSVARCLRMFLLRATRPGPTIQSSWK
jgi:hypothetical protein